MHTRSFPFLTSKRLHLRKLEKDDQERVLFLRSDQDINKFIIRPPHRQTNTLEDASTFIEKSHQGFENDDFIMWGITTKDQPSLIGTLCLWNFSEDRRTAEVGYDLDPKFHNKGYMSEALQQVLTFGFREQHLSTIEAHTHAQNVSSIHLLEKHKFQWIPERKLKGFEHNRIYVITASQFKS